MKYPRATVAPIAGLLAYPARHLRWKIIAPYVLLTFLLAVAGTYIATRMVTGSLEERFNNQLAEAARVTSDSVVRRERQHLEVVRGVAFTEGVSAALDDGDSMQLQALVQPLAANNGAELVEVLDAQGNQILGLQLTDEATLSYERLSASEDRASWAAVRSVLDGEIDAIGDKYAQIVQMPDGYALYTAGPVYEGDRLAGVILVGSLLESFLPAAKGEALADITIYDFDGAPLATTFATSGNEGEADLTPAPEALTEFGAPTALRESKTLYGRGFDLLYGELVIRDQVVGMYSVGLPSSFILGAGSATRWQLGLLFALATTGVLLAGWFLARGLTKPLFRLVGTARAVSQGDLTARSGVRSSDEVGVLATSFDDMTERLQRQHLATIRALTAAIDARDPYTAGHSARVGQLAVEIGTLLGLSDSRLQFLEIGGYLHDIGKIGIRDSILLKEDKLTPEERKFIEQHPRVGLDILSPVELAPDIVEFVGSHHEALDGSGYPAGRGSEELSIIPRIASVSDIYDALTTDRPYRAAMTVAQALEILHREKVDGKVDPVVVDTLEKVVPRWERLRRTEPALKGFRLTDGPVEEAA